MTTDIVVVDIPRKLSGFNNLVKSYVVQQQQTGAVKLLPSSEDVSRNKIITELIRSTPLYVGMRVKPASRAVYDREGTAVIKGMARNYQEFKGKMTESELNWPKNNNPMIVSAVYENSGVLVNATINYFIPVGDSFDD